jgi:serralysin
MAGVSNVSTRAYESMVAKFARASAAAAKPKGSPLAAANIQKVATATTRSAVTVSVSAVAQNLAASITTANVKAAGTVSTPLPMDANVRAVMFVAQGATKTLTNPGAWYWRTDTSTPTYTAGSGLSNAAKTLTYSFLSSATGADNTSFRVMSAAEKTAVRGALDYVSSVCGLTFTEASDGAKGNICFGTNKQKDSAGYATPPTGATTTNGSVNLFMNNSGTNAAIDMSIGSYGWEALVHEIGHTLGLKHPGNYNAGGGGAPAPYIAKSLDTRRFSLMSYNDAADMKIVSVADDKATQSTVNPATLQVYDVMALQWLYGAPITPLSQADFSKAGPMSGALTNTGQTSGTIIGNQDRANVIDLNPVNLTTLPSSVTHYSSIGIRDPYADLPTQFNTAAKFTAAFGTKLSATYTGINNLAIAPDSVYTTAIGGAKNDTLIGNAVSDITLQGNAGIDLFIVDPDGKAGKGQKIKVLGENGQGDGLSKNVLVLPGVSAANWSFSNGILTSSDGYYALTVSDVSAVKFGRTGLALSLDDFSTALNKTSALTALNKKLGKLTAVTGAPNLYTAANGNALVWGTGIDAKLGVTAKTNATQLLSSDGYVALGANQSIASSVVNADKSLTLLIAEKANGVTTSLKSMTFDTDGRQVGETQTTSLASLSDLVQAEYKYKLDFNGDKKVGFVVTSKLTPTDKSLKYAVYSMTSGGQTLAAFGVEGSKAGALLAPSTSMVLKNADGSPFALPSLTSYGYGFSTKAGVYSSLTLKLNGKDYVFGADGKLAA